jgi:hypothetical protein
LSFPIRRGDPLTDNARARSLHKGPPREMRSAGFFWGGRLADTVIVEGKRLTAHALDRRLEREIAARAAALGMLGATDDDVDVWREACAARFIERMCRHIDRLGR